MSSGVSPRNPSSAGGQPTQVFLPGSRRAGISESLPPGQQREDGARTGSFLRTSSGGRVIGQAAQRISPRGQAAGRGVGLDSSRLVPLESQPANAISSSLCVAREDSKHSSFHYNASHRRRTELCFYLRHRIRQLIGHVEPTPALTAAKTQRTPCGVNRYALLSVYFLYSFLTARVYFAWPSLSNLLFRSNAYEWLCDPAFPDLRLPENGGRRYRCEAQNSQVGSLFVTCLTFAFSCSLLAGVLLDFFGPKITALTGQLCNMLAWLLLAFAGKDAQTYFPAFIFMGIGSDVGYLPVLSSANLFPGHEGLVVACLGAAKSLSFGIPAILDALELGLDKATLKDVSLGYVAFGPGFCMLLSLVLIPLQAFIPWNEFVYLEEQPALAAARPLVRVNDSFASYEAHAWRDSFSSFQDVKDWMHQHHLATPLEELTHTNAAGSSSTRGPLLATGFLGAAATGTVSTGGGVGSAPTNAWPTTGGQQPVDNNRTVGGADTGRSAAAGSGTSTPTSSLQYSTGGLEEKGRKATDKNSGGNDAASKGETSEGAKERGLSTALYGSISTEAVLPSTVALEVSNSAGSELTEREAGWDNVQPMSLLRHPGESGKVPAETGKTVAQEGNLSQDARQVKNKEDRDGRGAAVTVVDRLLSCDTSVHSPAAAGQVGKRSNDPDEVTAGGESAAATTESEAGGAAAEEEKSAMTLPEGEREEQTLQVGEERKEPLATEEKSRSNALATEEESSERAAGVSSSASGGRGNGHRGCRAVQWTGAGRDDGSNRGGGADGGSSLPSHAAGSHREEEAVTPSFRRQFFSKYSFGIIFYSVLKALMYAFFTTGGENLLGKRVNDFLGAALPFSCVPCVLLGKVVDLVGIMPVLLLLNTCITLAYAFSMIPSTVTAYMGALLYICYVSFYSSQSYCYVSDTFSSCHFGKLVGTIHMIAGLLSLLKIPMQSMVVHLFHSNYLYPCVVMLVFCAANFVVLIWLVILKRRDPHPFWPQSARDAAAAEKTRRTQFHSQQKQNQLLKQQGQHNSQHQQETGAAAEHARTQQQQQSNASPLSVTEAARAVV